MPNGSPTNTENPTNQGINPTHMKKSPPPLPPEIPGRHITPSETYAIKPKQPITIRVEQPSAPQSEPKPQPVKPEQQALPKNTKTSKRSKNKKVDPGTTGDLPEGPASPPLNPKKDSSVKVTPDMLIENLHELFNVWRAIVEENNFGNTPDSGNSVMNLMSQEERLNNNIIFNLLKSMKLTQKSEYTYEKDKGNLIYYNASDLLNLIPCIARECGVKDFTHCSTFTNEYGKEEDIERRHTLPRELYDEYMNALKNQIIKLIHENFQLLDNAISQEIEKEIKKSEESLDKIHTVRFNEFLYGDKYETPYKIKKLRKTNLMAGFKNYTDALNKEIVKTKSTESEKGSDEKDETSLKLINLLDTFCESLKNARVAVNGITPKRCNNLKPGTTINLSDLKNVSKANKDAFVNEDGSKYRDQLIRITRSKTSRYLYYLAKILHYIDENIYKESEFKNINDILDKYDKQISKLKPSLFSNATISNNEVKKVIQGAIQTTKEYIQSTKSISSNSK